MKHKKFNFCEIFKNLFERSKGFPSRTEGLLGQTAKVFVEVNEYSFDGRVVIHGEDWGARSESGILPVDSLVTIVGFESGWLVVRKK
jgi:membrane protein implicated in regulation of membrane protease activity